MNKLRILKESLAAIPIIATIAGAAYVVARHRAEPFETQTLLSWVIALVAMMGIGELTVRYTLIIPLDRKLDALGGISQSLTRRPLAKAVLKDRSEYPPFAERVKNAREVCIMGISLQGMVSYHASAFVDRVQEGASLKFLVMDPASPSVEATAHGLFKANKPGVLRRDIESTIDRIKELRHADGSAVELRLTNYVPSCALVLIDPNKDVGSIIVELYPYLVSAQSRPHLELTQADGHWYKHFREQFEAIWRDAKVVP